MSRHDRSGALSSGPLSGLVVLDLTAMLAGPFATSILADLGADVIKIEPPGGDFIRHQGPFLADDTIRHYGGYFQSVNRNKRSVVLDLKSEDGREAFRALARSADCVVENFRNGVMDDLGLSYEELTAENAKLVYVAVRGFGDARMGVTPMQEWPAYDVNVQALSGIMEITGTPDGPPMKVGPGIGDMIPGLFAVVGVLAALHQAQASGTGEFVDVSMYDTMLAMCERTVYQYSYGGTPPTRQGNSHPLLCPFGVMPATDGWVSIAAPNDVHWRRLCDRIGRPELADDDLTNSNSQRVKNREIVDNAICEWTSVRTRAEIMTTLGGYVPAAPVNSVADIFEDPQVAARNMLVTVEQPGTQTEVTIVNSPLQFARSLRAPLVRAPLLGEHTDEVLHEHGLTLTTAGAAVVASLVVAPLSQTESE